MAGSIGAILFTWIILTETNSIFIAGVLNALGYIPFIFSIGLSFYASRLRKPVNAMILGVTIQALLIISVLAFLIIDQKILAIVAIFALVIVQALVITIIRPIIFYLEKEFLKEDQFQRGYSYYQFLNSGVEIAADLIAGISIAIGFTLGVSIMALGLFASILPLLSLRNTKNEIEEEKKPSFWEGLSFFRKEKRLLQITIYSLILNFGIGGLLIMLEDLVRIKYAGNGLILSILMISTFLGVMLGSRFSGRLKGYGLRFIIMGTVVIATVFIFIPSSPSFIFTSLAMFFYGFSIVIVEVCFHTIHMKIVPKELIMQTDGPFMTLTSFPSVFSPLLFGAILEFVSLSFGFYVTALILFLGLLLLLTFRDVRGISLSEPENPEAQTE